MRPRHAVLLVSVILAACASEPPLATKPQPPITFAAIAADHIGPYDLARLPTRTWSALRAGSDFGAPTRKGSVMFANVKQPSPIRDIAYVTDRFITESSYEDARLRFTVVNLDRELDAATIYSELEGAGLAPTRILGIDYEDHLIAATPSPGWFVRFRDGRPAGLAREVERPIAEEMEIRDVDALRALAGDRKQAGRLADLLDKARQPDLPLAAEWNAELDAIAQALYEPRMRPYRRRMAAIDERMARVRLLDRLPVFGEMAELLPKLVLGDHVIPPAREWHDRHFQAALAELKLALQGETPRTIGATLRVLREAAGLAALAKGKKPFHRQLENLEYSLSVARIRHQDPLEELARRLLWRPSRQLRAPIYHPGIRQSAVERALGRLVAENPEPVDGSFEAEVQQWLKQSNRKRNASQWRRAAHGYRAVGLARWLARCPASDVAAFCKVLEQKGAYDGLPRAIGTALRSRLAARLHAVATDDGDEVDAVVGHALATALEREESLGATLSRAGSLRQEARALRSDAALGDRLMALDALAGRSSSLGPAAELVAAELALPAGRELVEKAALVAKRGDTAHAAYLYLRAATVGTRTGPAPVSTWQVRRQWALLQRARNAGTASGLPERTEWLVQARMLAYAASMVTLPRLPTDEPVYDLQDRYLRSQLAGTSRLATFFGIRLSGMSDVRRGRKDVEDVRLVNAKEAVRWQPVADSGEAVDLAKYRVDAAGWQRLRTMRAEIDDIDAQLKAARREGSSSPAQLKSKDEELAGRAKELTARMQNGEVDPEVARGEIAAMKRESNALRSLIQNYNRRTQHINGLVERYNARIKPFNELLQTLLAQLATAYGELLEPATTAWIKTQTESKKTENERGIQRWMLGVRDAPELEGALPSPHPLALRDRVRNVSDPAAAARVLWFALEARQKRPRLWPGVALAAHVAALKPALVAYGQQYGTDAFYERILSRLPKDLHRDVVRFFEDKRRKALQKRVDGK